MNKSIAFKVVKWLAVIGALIMVYSTGKQMLDLPFWGYLPMYFFLGIWLAIVISTERFFSKHPEKYKLLLMSTLSGVLLYLGFPTMPFTPLMFIALIPLLYVEDKIFKWRERISRWEVFKYVFHAFVIWNILSTFWVANTAFVPSIAAFTLNALFMSIPWIGYHFVRKRLGDRYRYAALISFWLTFEWIHLNWEISWPWLTLGNSFAQYPFLVQWYEYTGHLGGSLWILLLNILFFEFIIKVKDKVNLKITDLLYPIFLMFMPMLLSVIMYVTYQEKGESRNISIIQPNYEPHYQKFTIPEEEQLRTFLRLSENSLTDSTDYLLYPETVFGGTDYRIDDLNGKYTLEAVKELLDSFPRVNFVTGLVTIQIFESEEEKTKASREATVNGEKLWWELQNVAVQFPAEDREDYDVHIKSKLVPGAEIFPYNQLLFFLKPIVRMAGGTLAGHGRTKERTVFDNQYGEAIAPAVCYESVYGEYVGQYVRKGADAIFIMTNDGWWDNTPGHVQHLKFASLRAIEQRKSVARAANTGISAFINQRGDMISQTAYDEETFLRGSIQFNTQPTFYTKWGDIIARIGILGSLILIVAGFVKKYKP